MLSNVCPYKTLGSFLLFFLVCIYNGVLCSIRPSDEPTPKYRVPPSAATLAPLLWQEPHPWALPTTLIAIDF
jgi:hypothetical protein